MAGGLHVLDMIKSIRNNRNLKENSYYKGENYRAREPKMQLEDTIKASPEVLKHIQASARREAHDERRKTIIALIVSAVVVSTLIALLFIFL